MINYKEQAVLKSIKDVSEGEETRNRVLGYKIDLCFHE